MKRTFTRGDRDIVRKHIFTLSNQQAKVIYLRYWQRCSIADIARELRQSWERVYMALQMIHAQLRAQCLTDGRFSHSTRNIET